MILLWACLASALLWLSRRMRERFGLSAELPQHPKTRDLLLFSLRKLGPWLVAFLITLYLSVVLPDSLSKTLAMVMAYVLVCGTLFSALCVISSRCSAARTASAPWISCGARRSARCG